MSNLETYNKTKLTIINASKPLFWHFGYQKVTIEEIAKASKISKMTFYRHFKNKEALILALMKMMFDHSYSTYRNLMDSELPFIDKMEQLITIKFEEIKGISKQFVTDIYGRKSEKLFHLMEENNTKMMTDIYNDFSKAQKDGELDKNIKIEFLMYMMNDLNQKLFDEHLNKLFEKEEDLIKALNNHFFYGILSRK